MVLHGRVAYRSLLSLLSAFSKSSRYTDVKHGFGFIKNRSEGGVWNRFIQPRRSHSSPDVGRRAQKEETEVEFK